MTYRRPSVGKPAVLTVVSFVDEGLGNSSYLVDLGDGRALVVDPVRDPSGYLETAERMGLRVAYAAETHLHADFVSGGRELAAHGATLLAPAGAQLAFDHLSLEDGAEITLGGLVLRAVATPGHTPEHLSYVIADDQLPVAAFTGGALIVGSVARTDLIAGDQTEHLTREAYRSVNERLGSLPDDVAVYPTHGAGSFCSVTGSSDRTTSVGRERTTNDALTAVDEDAFVESFTAGLGSYPPYFLRLRPVNRRGPTPLADLGPSLAPLSVDDVQQLIEAGAEVIDARTIEDFAVGHIPGSISIELRPQFASWLGWVARDDRPLVFVLDAKQDRSDVLRQCLKIGYERLAGELAGGMDAWRAAGSTQATIGLVVPEAIVGTAVDVRQDSEARTGRIDGAVHIELGQIRDAELPAGELTLYCGHGQRGMTAASLLAREGRDDVNVLIGGPNDWASVTGRSLDHG